MARPFSCVHLMPLTSSLLINVLLIMSERWFGDRGFSWSRRAAEDEESAAIMHCSGHGRAFLDGLVLDDEDKGHSPRQCECNRCYRGHECSEFLPDCTGRHRMSYYNDDRSYISKRLENASGHGTMTRRWKAINSLLSDSHRFSLLQIPSRFSTYFNQQKEPTPAYAWLKCEEEEEGKSCHQVVGEAKIIGREGSMLKADDRYITLSLIRSEDDFEMLVRHLQELIDEIS